MRLGFHHRRFLLSGIVGFLAGWSAYYLFFQIPDVISKTRFGFAVLTAVVFTGLLIYFWESLIGLFSNLNRNQHTTIIWMGAIFALLFLIGYFIFPVHPVENLLIPAHRLTITSPANSIDPVEITWMHNGLGDISFSALQVEGGDAKRQIDRVIFSPLPNETMQISWEGRAWKELIITVKGNDESGGYAISLDEHQETWYLNREPGVSLKKTLPVRSPIAAWLVPAAVINLAAFGLLTFLISLLMVKFSDRTSSGPDVSVLAAIFSTAAVVAVLALIIYIGWFNRYLYDDYCYAVTSRNLNFGECMQNRLINTNGRFSQLTLLCVIDRIQPLGFRLSAGLAQIGLFLSSYLMLRQVFPTRSRKLAFIFAAGFDILILVCVPYIEHTIFWYSGMVTVVPPLILFNLMVAVIWSLSSQPKSSFWMSILLFLIAVLAAGFNETQDAVLIGLGLLFLLLTSLPQTNSLKSARQPVGIALLGTLIGFALLALLPGTSSRLGRYQQLFSLGQLALETIRCSLDSLHSIFPGTLGAAIYAGVSLGGLLAGTNIGRGKVTAQNTLTYSTVSLLMGAAAYVGAFIPSMVATNNCIPFRSMITPEYFLLLGLFLCAYWLGRALNLRPFRRVIWVAVAVNILLAAALFNRYLPVLDKYKRYADGYDQRLVVIEKAIKDGQPMLEVDPILTPQELYGDILDTYNPCAAGYFGIDVRLNEHPQEFK